MAKPKPISNRLPVKYPSVPDAGSEPGNYNEPALPSQLDRMPQGRMQTNPRESRAALRLQVERLLLRRDAVSEKDWRELGSEARTLLVELLDDEAIRCNDALRRRVIAVLGSLAVKRGIAPLSVILSSGSESSLTKAYAATALGHIGEGNVIPTLAAAMTEKDDMVRRQVAKALARLDRVESVPHLLKLRADPSIAVSEIAVEALKRWETKLGQRLGKAKKSSVAKTRPKKIAPAPEH